MGRRSCGLYKNLDKKKGMQTGQDWKAPIARMLAESNNRAEFSICLDAWDRRDWGNLETATDHADLWGGNLEEIRSNTKDQDLPFVYSWEPPRVTSKTAKVCDSSLNDDPYGNHRRGNTSTPARR